MMNGGGGGYAYVPRNERGGGNAPSSHRATTTHWPPASSHPAGEYDPQVYLAAFLSTQSSSSYGGGHRTTTDAYSAERSRRDYPASTPPYASFERLTASAPNPLLLNHTNTTTSTLRSSSNAANYDELFLAQQQQVLLRSCVSDPFAPTTAFANGTVDASSAVTPEVWMDEIHLEVSAIALEPLTGHQILVRIQEKLNDILYKYIPCVNFLVQCQQDLRKGLEYNTTKPYGGRKRHDVSVQQFYANYIEPLACNFYKDNQHRVDAASLQEAIDGLLRLQDDAKKVERQGCEAMKSSYLGGMKDGESWGLRKWLSKHGGALPVCTDLECILSAVQQQLDRTHEATRLLAARLRAMTRQVLQRLQKDIPTSYQQHSSAHPYLPFFHRLESALRGMSNFDPEDDDVICLDDSDDDDEVEVVRSTQQQPPVKRPWTDAVRDLTKDDDDDGWTTPMSKRPATEERDGNSSSGESEIESIVEIVDIMDGGSSDWVCPNCSMINVAGESTCLACGEESLFKGLLNFSRLDDLFDDPKGTDAPANMDPSRGVGEYSPSMATRPPLWPVPLEQPELQKAAAAVIADNLEKIAGMFDQNQQSSIRSLRLPEGSFWDGERYASALRLFAQILRSPDASPFLECVDDDRLIQAGNNPLFSHVIKHPLSLRLIARAILGDELQLTQSGVDGFLSVRGLSNWNMWFGKDLLQAIDLVFLNSLAYGNALNQGKSQYRSATNQLRKMFWSGITGIVEGTDTERRKQCMPTRRAEKSGFVVYKIGESG